MFYYNTLNTIDAIEKITLIKCCMRNFSLNITTDINVVTIIPTEEVNTALVVAFIIVRTTSIIMLETLLSAVQAKIEKYDLNCIIFISSHSFFRLLPFKSIIRTIGTINIFVQKQKLSFEVTFGFCAYSLGMIPLNPQMKNKSMHMFIPFLPSEPEKNNGTATAHSLNAIEIYLVVEKFMFINNSDIKGIITAPAPEKTDM